MRTSHKLFRMLFIWGMVPLIVWSGCPVVGCACTTAAAETTCGCCAQESAPTKKCCCCGAKSAEEAPGTVSVKPLPQKDLGLLVHCSCGQKASRAHLTLESERKSAAEDLVSQDADILLAPYAPDPPSPMGVAESVASFVHSDRVILFHAFLI